MKYIATMVLSGLVAGLAACSPTGSSEPVVPALAGVAEPMSAIQAADAAAMKADPRLVVVHKSESCGCCHLWVEHLERSGLKVAVCNASDLDGIKERVGVPPGMISCHT